MKLRIKDEQTDPTVQVELLRTNTDKSWPRGSVEVHIGTEELYSGLHGTPIALAEDGTIYIYKYGARSAGFKKVIFCDSRDRRTEQEL